MFYVYQWRCICDVYLHFLSDIFSSAILLYLITIATCIIIVLTTHTGGMLYGMNNETIWKKKKDPAKYYNKTDQNKNKNPTMAALAKITNVTEEFDSLSRLLDEIEALQEIFLNGFIIVDIKKLQFIKTIFNSIVSTPSDFTFASIEKSFLSFQIKVISELSIADDLPPCIVEIILNVPVNYIMKNDEKKESHVNVIALKCEEISSEEKKSIMNQIQEISNNANDEETLYVLFQTGIDKCTEMVESARKTRLFIQNEMLQQKIELEKLYQQSQIPILGRRMIFSHHIIADSKRSAVCNWAAELKLSGFSKIGWPGLILVEGDEENCKIYVQSLQRLRWKMLVVRGEQQVKGDMGQSLDDLRVIKNKRFIEFGKNQMSQFAQTCRDYDLEDLFFAALKMKPKTNDGNKSNNNNNVNKITTNEKVITKKKKGKNKKKS